YSWQQTEVLGGISSSTWHRIPRLALEVWSQTILSLRQHFSTRWMCLLTIAHQFVCIGRMIRLRFSEVKILYHLESMWLTVMVCSSLSLIILRIGNLS